MDKFTIAITTFSKRFNFIEQLIPDIRSITNEKILLVVNGEKDGQIDDEYRKNVLTLCSRFKHVYPIFFIECRGLSKLWNTAIVNSPTDNILLFNDDVRIFKNDIFDYTKEFLSNKEFDGLLKFNGSFSHFLVNKNLMEKVGYFDERLLGFGEEDGDITFRLNQIGLGVLNVTVDGLLNIISDLRHDHIKAGIGKYSSFNREFIYGKKYVTDEYSSLQGMFDQPMSPNLEDHSQYPYEIFFRVNKNNL